ncbi:hypothetical protein CYMTET_37662 [Cymbomonas tetramitiformis]|uniref:Uncharacterized protein n=1 Tax=Cymbomonas tetramitiformis TaxID=36881 RepID=A0AAE0F5R7_9CHLO|nr:hypothetical protein CYMTET_37662 [Cymbomonas tetramitiformis]
MEDVEAFEFDPANTSSKYLELSDPNSVRCHTNCNRNSQGTTFIRPALRPGGIYKFTFQLHNKPGRMHYFFGISDSYFPTDAGYQEIQKAAYSLENLYASVHSRKCCSAKGLPSFHTGSTVTMDVNLQEATLSFTINGGQTFRAKIGKNKSYMVFTSLYNREAHFSFEGYEVVSSGNRS